MPLWVLGKVFSGDRSDNFVAQSQPHTGEMKELEFVSYPHNENFELDLHRPYIDEVELISGDGKPLKRIPEVIDGWVESGSMPFAEYH